jgi:hypothetical protein
VNVSEEIVAFDIPGSVPPQTLHRAFACIDFIVANGGPAPIYVLDGWGLIEGLQRDMRRREAT